MLASPARIVAGLLAAAALLSLAMAFTEGINNRPELWRGPPDEYGHRSAARYYVDHWLPPKVGDVATLDSYSRDYGYSYVNDLDPVYLLAGKFAALVSPVLANHDRAFRLFNVALLVILALICRWRPLAWLAFVPLLLSPQVWYIFSYFNGDAFPLFLTVLLAYQVAVPESAFNRYIDSPGVWRGFAGAVLVGILVALLALSKKNFLAFLAFVPAAFALGRLGASSALLVASAAIAAAAFDLKWISLPDSWLYALAAAATAVIAVAVFAARHTRRERARVVAKLAVMALVAVAVAVPRFAWDAIVNGSLEQKRLAQGALQERFAKPEYKPSQVYQGTNPQATYYGLELRARGTPLRDLFGPFWSWHTKTFTTATGSYGWLQFNSPKPYAVLLIASYAAIFAIYAWAVVRARQATAVASFALVLAFSALMLAVAVFHSWNNDFQAQGRYLFPIAGMLAIGLIHVRRWIAATPLLVAVAACFALSVYSFVFVGLREVQRAF